MDTTTTSVDSLPRASSLSQSFIKPPALAISSSLLEDAELALQNLSNQEVQLIEEMESLFKNQVEHFKHMDQLKQFAPDMTKIDMDTKRLLSLVDSSSALVDDVCNKVKRIDLAKDRLEDCLCKVADILDLKRCRQGTLKALEAGNYEEAAIYVKRYLSIDKVELRKTIGIISGKQAGIAHSHGTVPKSNSSKESNDIHDDQEAIDPKYMELAISELDDTRNRLLKLCQDMMTQAIKQDATRDIEKFFKIFPMLNEHLDGLSRYASYLQTRIINGQVDAAFESSKLSQADKLASLYETIARLIDQHQPLIETFYGPGYLIFVVKIIQKECDRLSRKLLEEFRNTTKLQSVAKLVRAAALQSPITGFSSVGSNLNNSTNQTINLTPSKLDPRDVDSILNQISLIISRSEVYLNFLVERVKEDIKSKAESEAQKQASLLELYKLICIECELNHLVQEVGGIYVMLEQFYLNESSKKAILLDQIDTESASYPVSSMLDDIFFIVKKCINRAISTKSIEVFCAIINHSVTLLESVFCQVLDDKLKNQQYYSVAFTTKNLDLSQAYSAIQSGRYLQSASELESARAQYFSALNNLDKACDYTQTLRSILNVDVKKLKPPLLVIEQQHDNQIEKSLTCLNELNQLVSKFSSIANSSLYQLFNSSLRSRIKTELKALFNENPDLASSVPRSSEEMLDLARNLLITLDRTLQDFLTTENYNKLVMITRDFLASTLRSQK